MAEINDDELLIEKFRRGDESAFERVVERYSADVAALANRLLGWPGEVEDVTQEIFLAAFLGLKKFRCDCSLKSWLFTIAINKCRSYRYKRWLRLRRFAKEFDKVRLPSITEEHVMDADDFKHVRRAVAALEIAERRVNELNARLVNLQLPTVSALGGE